MIHNNLAVVYHQLKDKERAGFHYQNATKLTPDNISFPKNLAAFYYAEMDRIEDAIEIYVTILKDNPKDVETLLMLGHISMALEHCEDAIFLYKSVLKIEPLNAYAKEGLNRLKAKGYGRRDLQSFGERFQNMP